MKTLIIGAALMLLPSTIAAAAPAGGPPVITLISPLERAVARPYIHVVASCASDDPSGCVSMTVSSCAPTNFQPNNPITVPGSLVDLFVRPCAYFDDFLGDFGSTVTYVDVSGVDAAGRRTSRRVVNIGTDLNPTLRALTSVDGQIVDVRDGRIAYIRNYNSHTEYELQPAAPPELWIRNFLSPAADERVPTPAAFYDPLSIKTRLLTPHGVMFVTSPTSAAEPEVFEWRDHSLLDLGHTKFPPQLNERYAVWVTDAARRHLVIRDLLAGVNQEATFDVDVITLQFDRNGTVVFTSAASGPNQLFLYRAGQLTQLTFDQGTTYSLSDGAIDGDRLLYSRTSASGYVTILRDLATNTEVQLEASGIVEGGWIAYAKQLPPNNYPAVFLRDPGGSVSQLTSGAYAYPLALAPDGETLVRLLVFSDPAVAGNYLVRRGTPPRRVVSDQLSLSGTPAPYYSNGRWFFVVKSTLFEPAETCGLTVTSSSGRYAASGGNGTLAIGGPDGCAWSAAGVPPWISITSGARGAGSGAVVFSVAPNTGRGRTATIEIAGQAVTIRQDAAGSPHLVRNDFTGGGRALRAVYRAAGSQWWVEGNTPMATWGEPGWIQVPGDYNGDGQIDLAAFAPDTGTWVIRGAMNAVWGTAGDLPVPADYDGDGRADLAVFRPATGQWFVKDQLATTWGLPGDLPVPADYTGDGRADVAVFRPSTGEWFVRGGVSAKWGQPGDIPVPADYDGNGATEIAVFRPATGVWYVKGLFTRQFGTTGDLPVPLDFNGDGRAELAVYRRATGTWFVEDSGPGVQYGLVGDLPLGFPSWLLPRAALDQGGDHRSDAAFYQTSSHQWIVQQSTANFTTRDLFSFGMDSDVRRLADFDGDGRGDLVLFRPSTGMWYVNLSATGFREYVTYGPWGASGDAMLPGDYDGDRKSDLMVFRASEGRWYLKTSSSAYASSWTIDWGMAGDIAVPADYDGDGRLDVAVFRPSTGRWYVKRSSDGGTMTLDWGTVGDVPVPADYDGDGQSDIAIFRPATGAWWIRYSSTGFTTSATVVYGASGDVPIPGDYNGDGLAEPAYFRPGVGFFVTGIGPVYNADSSASPIRER